MAMSPIGCRSWAPGSAKGQKKGSNLRGFPLLPWAMPVVVPASLPGMQLPEDRPVAVPASAGGPSPWAPVASPAPLPSS